MDKLSEHAIRMLEIVDNERGFFKDMDGEVADIARAVYDTILQVQMLKMADRKGKPQTETHDKHTETHSCVKDEPNNSEKPNNCEKDCFLCKWLGEVDVCGRCRNRNLFAEANTEPKPKDEPQKKEVEWVYNKRERLWYPYSNGELLFKDEPQTERSSE